MEDREKAEMKEGIVDKSPFVTTLLSMILYFLTLTGCVPVKVSINVKLLCVSEFGYPHLEINT